MLFVVWLRNQCMYGESFETEFDAQIFFVFVAIGRLILVHVGPK